MTSTGPVEQIPAPASNNDTAAVSRYIDRLDIKYAKPAIRIFSRNFDTNPNISIFIAASLLLSVFPIISFASISLSLITLVTIVIVSGGIILIIALELALVLVFLIVLSSILLLSTIVTALWISASFVVHTVSRSASVVPDALLQENIDMASISTFLASYLPEMPGLQATILERVSRISLAIWRAIPWKNSVYIVLAAVRTVVSSAKMGLLLAQWITPIFEILFTATRIVLLFLGAALSRSLTAFHAMRTLNMSVQSAEDGEDIGVKDEHDAHGVSTSVSVNLL